MGVLLYKRSTHLVDINELRKVLFAQGNRQLENIPPSKAALTEHIKRALFQAGHIWGQVLNANPVLPSPAEFGWVKEENIWGPFWSIFTEASKGCVIKCSCKRQCSGRCKCFKARMNCTQLCACGGDCYDEPL